jgi:sec-independent protein translocase protein TatA
MPFGTGHWPFLLILLVIVLIIWGPGKLPELGSGMGKAIREFRKASTEVKDQFTQSTSEPTQPQPPTAAAPPAATTAPPAANGQPAQQQPAQPATPVAHPSGGEQHPA